MPSQKTNTTQQQSGPPADYADAYRALVGAASNLAQSPLNQYAGPMVAGFTPQQQSAFQTIDNSQGMYAPFINAAAQQYGAATAPLWKGLPQFDTSDLPGIGKAGLNMALSSANKASGFADRAAAPFDVPGYDTLPTYFNPYQSYVTDTLKNLFNTQNGEQMAQLRGNAALHGAYGGDRDVVAQSIAARQQKLADDSQLAQVQQQGFAQAQNELNNQQDLALRKGLGMGQLSLGAGNLAIGSGNLGLQGGQAAFNEFNNQQSTQLTADQANRWLAMQAGQGYGNLGNMAQNMALTGAQAQLGAGGLQQQLAQSQLNIPYQQFLQTQAYPYQALSFLSPIVQGTGSLSGGIGTTSSPGPSTLSQLGGLGLTGAGIYGLGNQQGWWGSGGGMDYGGGQGIADFATPAKRGGRMGYAPGGSVFDLPDIPGIGHDVPTIDVSYIPHVIPGTERPSPYGMGSGAQHNNSGGSGGSPSGGGDIMGGIGTAVSMAAKFLPLLLSGGGRAGFAEGGDTEGGMGTPHGLPPVPKINLDYMIPPGPAVKGSGPPKPPPSTGLTPAGSDSGRMLDWTKDLKSSGLLGTTESGTTTHAAGGRIGFDDGGGVGDPAYQQLLTMPLAQLQAMAAQNPPTTPQGQMIAQAIAAQQSSGFGTGAPPSPPPVGGAGGMGAASTPTASAGTSRLATSAQDFGGTAYPMAAGGQVPGYVTEDELDPHPVVDHSGRTVKIRYPSEGRELDLGLPSIKRPDFDAGGSAGATPEMIVPQLDMPGMSSYMGNGGIRVPQLNVPGGDRSTIFGGVGRGTTRWMDPGAGLGSWFAPLAQYRPEGMGPTGPGGSMVYPSNIAYLPQMAGILGQINKNGPLPAWAGGNSAAAPGVGAGAGAGVSPDLTQLAQFFGDGGGNRRGGRIGFDDGGSVPTDYGLTPMTAWSGGGDPMGDPTTAWSGGSDPAYDGLTGNVMSAPDSNPAGAIGYVSSAPDTAIPGIVASAPPPDGTPGWGTGAVQMPGNPTWWSAGQYIPDPTQMARASMASTVQQQPGADELNAMLAAQQPGFGPPPLPTPQELAGASGGYQPPTQLPSSPSWAEMGSGQIPGLAPPVGGGPPAPSNSGGGFGAGAPTNSPTGGFGAPHKIGGRAGFDEGGDVTDDSGLSGYARVLPMEGDVGVVAPIGDSGATAVIPPIEERFATTARIPEAPLDIERALRDPAYRKELIPDISPPGATYAPSPTGGGIGDHIADAGQLRRLGKALRGSAESEALTRNVPLAQVERERADEAIKTTEPFVYEAPFTPRAEQQYRPGGISDLYSRGIGDWSMSPDLAGVYIPGIGGTPRAAAAPTISAPDVAAAPSIPTLVAPPREVTSAAVAPSAAPRGTQTITRAQAAAMNAADPEKGRHLPVMPTDYVFGKTIPKPQVDAAGNVPVQVSPVALDSATPAVAVGKAPPQLTPPSETPQSGIVPGDGTASPPADAVDRFSLRSTPTVDPVTGTTKDPKDMVAHYESEGAARRMGISAYNVGYGSTDLTNTLKSENGFPIWEGKTFKDTDGQLKRTHAAGRYQFQQGTWDRYAAPLGIKDFSPESQDRVFRAAFAAEGFKPWEKFNPALAAALKSGTGVPVGGATGTGTTGSGPVGTGPADQLVKAGASPQAAGAIQQVADRALDAVPESERSSMKEWMNSPYFLAFLAGAGMLASHSPFPGVALGEGLKTAATGAVQMRAQDSKEEIAQIRNQGILDKAGASNSVALARLDQGDERLRQGNERIAQAAALATAKMEADRAKIEKDLGILDERSRHNVATEAEAAKRTVLQNELLAIRQQLASGPKQTGEMTPKDIAGEVTRLWQADTEYMTNPQGALRRVLKGYGMTVAQYQQLLGVQKLLGNATPATPGLTPSAPALPPAAVSQLKEGEVTTFGNGQKWTLSGGKPAQVP